MRAWGLRMANRYAVNILKNEGATIITLANASFVGFAPPKLTQKLSPGEIDSLPSIRNQAIGGEVLTFQLERREQVLWVSPPFLARVIAAGENHWSWNWNCSILLTCPGWNNPSN
jgi:hypothetical protein